MAYNLILIGNGFDLAHGLQTSYSNFLSNYLEEISKKASQDGYYDDEDWSIQLKPEIANVKASIAPNELMKSKSGVSCKNVFLDGIRKDNSISHVNEGSLWADLEGHYYKKLRELVPVQNSNPNSTAIDNLNVGFESIKKLLINYLETVNQSIDDLIETHEQPFAELLTGIWDKQNHESLVVNFNYTSTLKLYDNDFGPKSIINFHGSLGNMEKNPIIFGFGDTKDDHYTAIENLNENKFLKYSKLIAYRSTNNYQRLLDFMNYPGVPYNVHIIGLSCGITDRVLLNTILEHNKCESIKVYHYRDRDNFIETVTNISRVFKDKQKFSKRIVPYNSLDKFSG